MEQYWEFKVAPPHIIYSGSSYPIYFRSNWNLEKLAFVEEGKPENPLDRDRAEERALRRIVHRTCLIY